MLGVVQAGARSPIDLGAPMHRKMIAALAVEARPVSRDELVDILWDRPPRSAVNVLRTYASRLRSLVGARHIASIGDGYALVEYTSDVVEFEEWADIDPHRALRLWRGQPLAGLDGYWTDATRGRYEERRLAVTEDALAMDVADGRGSTTADLVKLCARYPLREKLRTSLMLSLFRDGRQGDAIAEYASLRKALDTELGILPATETASAYRRIIDGSALSPRIRSRTPITPAQLPADIPDFFGRDALVQHLTGARLSHDTPSVWTISGLGGIGKTALAVRVAHRLRSQFPDGQLAVDLRGSSSDPADPAAVLRQFLTALGVSGIPDEVDRRSALLRSVLATRRVLLLLDNARDNEQILPLLPGSGGCAVLVTSRSRMVDVPGAPAFALEVLDHREALDLFAGIIGGQRTAAEPAEASAVVRMCGNLPLAVRIAASRLTARPGWSLASLRDRLADYRDRLPELRAGSQSVSAAFALAYEQLDPGQARAFRLLAVADAPAFAIRTARIVLHADSNAAEERCEQLSDLGLLDPKSYGSYGFHDLVREYGASIVTESERRDVIGRIARDWLSTVRNASRVLEDSPQDRFGMTFPAREHAERWINHEVTCLSEAISHHRDLPPPADVLGSTVVVATALHEIGAAIGGMAHPLTLGLAALGRGDDGPLVRTALGALGALDTDELM